MKKSVLLVTLGALICLTNSASSMDACNVAYLRNIGPDEGWVELRLNELVEKTNPTAAERARIEREYADSLSLYSVEDREMAIRTALAMEKNPTILGATNSNEAKSRVRALLDQAGEQCGI